MRDRLIELIKQAKKQTKNANCDIERNMIFADYLLENGVIVSPVKIGDTVYVIEPCTCYNNYRTYDECHHRRTKATKWIEMVRVPKKHSTKCLKLFERPFKIEYLNKIGITVFLTKEQAEQALYGE